MTRANPDQSREPGSRRPTQPVPCPAAADAERSRRLAGLLNQYGTAKFGDEWWPGNAAAWLPADAAAELATLQEQEGVTAAPADTSQFATGRQDAGSTGTGWPRA